MVDSKTIDQGGPAFPELGNVGYKSDWQSENGMSFRDWLAGQMLVGMGTWMPVPASGCPSLHSDETLRARAEIAYRQADAMIAVRKVGA